MYNIKITEVTIDRNVPLKELTNRCQMLILLWSAEFHEKVIEITKLGYQNNYKCPEKILYLNNTYTMNAKLPVTAMFHKILKKIDMLYMLQAI